MMRHPFWTLAELGAALWLAVCAHVGLGRPPVAPPPVEFTLAWMGERERDAGGWEGVDLLEHPDAPVDRFQLTLRPQRPVFFTVDLITSAGLERIFPLPGQRGLLQAGVAYALPGPRTFYGVEGAARIRVGLRFQESDPQTHPVAALAEPGKLGVATYRLTDGAPFRTREQLFSAPGACSLELTVRGTGSVGPAGRSELTPLRP